MARGRLPGTAVVSMRGQMGDSFYPFKRCQTCLAKWKMKMTDVTSGKIKRRSCKDNCVLIRMGA